MRIVTFTVRMRMHEAASNWTVKIIHGNAAANCAQKATLLIMRSVLLSIRAVFRITRSVWRVDTHNRIARTSANKPGIIYVYSSGDKIVPRRRFPVSYGTRIIREWRAGDAATAPAGKSPRRKKSPLFHPTFGSSFISLPREATSR